MMIRRLRKTARLVQLRATMRFGEALVLRSAPTAAGQPVYRLTSALVETRTMGAGVATRFTFGAVKKLHGVPYVDLVAATRRRPAGRTCGSLSPGR
jgi:hypothetical protein